MRRRNPVPLLVAVPVGVAAVGGLTYGITQWLLRDGDGLPLGMAEPAFIGGVPQARGISDPVWPVATRHPNDELVSYKDVSGAYHGSWARRFGAPRAGRNHAGMDLYAYYGDPVLAMGDGVVTSMQPFHLGSWSIFVDHGGTVLMYGEIAPNSWREFGVTIGTAVTKGYPIARVACMDWQSGRCESHMLHIEAYRPGTKKNKRWYGGRSPPVALLDPTRLLLLAS